MNGLKTELRSRNSGVLFDVRNGLIFLQHTGKSEICPKFISHEDNRVLERGHQLLTERNAGEHRLKDEGTK